jgi:hypothetical protein
MGRQLDELVRRYHFEPALSEIAGRMQQNMRNEMRAKRCGERIWLEITIESEDLEIEASDG